MSDTHFHPSTDGSNAVEHEDRSAGHLGRSYRPHRHGADGIAAPGPTGNPSTKDMPRPGYMSSDRLERAPSLRVPTDLARRLREQ